ncbi:MAG: cation-translocating P-type ATPase [Eubacteriales bacterium]|nr:cation-translocating P-type ATPase [Eubacteriales bacterium]
MASDKKFFNRAPEDIFLEFGSSADGLSEDKVRENREKFGSNKLPEKKQKNIIQIFLDQFKDLLVIILIIAAIISMATGNADSTVIIIAVLILNAILGTVQNVKARKSLESLKKLSSPEAKVIRGGVQKIIPAEELVPGDIAVLDAGDIIPGDGRIIECHNLKTNESSLTGESVSSEKSDQIINDESVPLGDQDNMVFSGTLVTYGRARAVITGTGVNTELGRIATLMEDTSERKTPLQVTMDNFSKKLSIAIMIISVIVFGLSIFRNMPVLDALLFAVALAVAAIPEALSSIITISLAIGTKRMAGQNAIIKDLNAVEGLGCVSVICSDKTGTLTQNKMTVEYEEAVEGEEKALSLASILCNDTAIVDGKTTGDPTETAFVDYYMKKYGDYEDIKSSHPRLSEVPFDSDRKLMSTLHEFDGRYVMFTKGAIDVILGRSINLTKEQKKRIAEKNYELSSNGLRVLAFAMKAYDDDVDLTYDDENDLKYIGLMAEVDPPREESKQAVFDCKEAGIKPIMITGDHKVTASAIARRIGIMEDGDLAVTGAELDQMSDDELREKLPTISVYARVSPDNKIRIVKAWQDEGQIVSMTGDGVNDGPALKSADIGVAMGITGTEVAKDSASMILTDDNFATIIKAVLNGRNVYENIKNAITYLLSGNAAAIVAVLFASIAGLSMPFTAVQLLFINLITDSLPALAISMEPLNYALIDEKPRARSESVLNRPTVKSICLTGLLISIVTIIAFLIGLGTPIAGMLGISGVKFGPVAGSTMAFSTLCLARLWHGFNCRGKEGIFKLGLFSNIYSIGAFVLGAALLHVIIMMPFFSEAFGVAMLNRHLLIYVWILSFIPTLIIQIYKGIKYRNNTVRKSDNSENSDN